MLLGWDGYFRPLEVRTVQSVVGPCHLDAVGTRGPVLYVDQYMRRSKGSWSGLSPTCSQQEAYLSLHSLARFPRPQLRLPPEIRLQVSVIEENQKS